MECSSSHLEKRGALEESVYGMRLFAFVGKLVGLLLGQAMCCEAVVLKQQK
jgi:hypothetical protein